LSGSFWGNSGFAGRQVKNQNLAAFYVFIISINSSSGSLKSSLISPKAPFMQPTYGCGRRYMFFSKLFAEPPADFVFLGDSCDKSGGGLERSADHGVNRQKTIKKARIAGFRYEIS
jgi:hypothetical protein